jgi:hypothetical protein
MPTTDYDLRVCIYGEWVTGSMTGGIYYFFVDDFGALLDHPENEVLPEDT